MRRAVALGCVLVLTGFWASHAVAQTSRRLLTSLSTGLNPLECGIAGPVAERLRSDELLSALERGVAEITSRHDEDDGAYPSLRVLQGRPRIDPGGRATLRRGVLLIDGIWENEGPDDTPGDLLRDATRFLDAGVVDGDDIDEDDSLSVIERAVLTQAFAYAVNSRTAALCGTALGGSLRADAGAVQADSGRPEVAEQSIVTAGPGVGSLSPAGAGRMLSTAPPEMARRRSWGRTGAGLGLIGGAFLVAAGYQGDGDTAENVAVTASWGMIGTGVLLATLWSDVPAAMDQLTVNVAPDGYAVLRSFSW